VKNIKSTIVNQAEAEVASLEIKKLSYSDKYKAYILEFEVGLQIYKCELQPNDTFYFKKLELYGLLQNTIENDVEFSAIYGEDYFVFITSDDLHFRIKPDDKKLMSENELFNVYNHWQIEFIRKHNEYEVYFLKLATIDENLNRHLNHKYLTDYRKFYYGDKIRFKGFFGAFEQTKYEPTKYNRFKKFYLRFELPSNKTLLSEISKVNLPIGEKTYNCELLVGGLTVKQLSGYIYIIPLENLILFQKNPKLKGKLYFKFNDKILPLPSLPILTDEYSYKFEKDGLHSEFMTRSLIICIYISPSETLIQMHSGHAYHNIDYDKLISIFKADHSNKENYKNNPPEEENDDQPFNDLGDFDNEYPTIINKTDYEGELPFEDEIPSKVLLYPANKKDLEYLLPKEFEDYDEMISQGEQERKDLETEEFLRGQADNYLEDEYPSYWDALDFDQQFSEDEDRAMSEGMESDSDKYDDMEYYSGYEINLTEIISNTYLVYMAINKKLSPDDYESFAVFEINRDDIYHQRRISKLIKCPLVNDCEVYTGVLNVEENINLFFILINKNSGKVSKKKIKKLFNLDNYKTIKTNNFDIYFNLDYPKKCSGETRDLITYQKFEESDDDELK